MGLGLLICPKCGTLVDKKECQECHSLVTQKNSLNLKVTSLPVTEEPVETEPDTFIGPLEDKCSRCKQIKCVYFQMNTPSSTDEPFIIKYKCKNCNHQYSTYK